MLFILSFLNSHHQLPTPFLTMSTKPTSTAAYPRDGIPVSGTSVFDFPSGPRALSMLGMALAAYVLSATHVTPFLINQGVVDRFIAPLLLRSFALLRLGAAASGRLPTALLTLAAANTFVLSAVGSITAVGYSVGWRNKEPRRAGRAALSGLAARTCATHDSLLESFGVFAAAAVLAQFLGTAGQFDKELALAFFLK